MESTDKGQIIEFRAHGNLKQVEAFKYWTDKSTYHIVYGGSKASGKSFLGCSLILADALIYPGTHYFIARKTLSDLRKHTTTSIAEVLNGWGIPSNMYRYNGQDNFYQFKNGSKVYFFGCEPRPSDPKYTRLGSIQMTRGWIEESGEVEEAAKNALSATIGRWKNEEYGLWRKLLMTCNPDKGWLYSEYYEPWKNNSLDKDKKFIQALPTDNKMLDDGYLEGLEQSLNYNERQRLLHGNWEFDDDPSVLIDYEAIMDIFRNFSVPHGKKYITVDVARMGGARIVCVEWDGYRGHVRSWDRAEFPETLKRIEESRMKLGISPKDVLVDGDGMGAGLADFGRYSEFRNNFPAVPSKDQRKRRDANGNIIKENFDNRKSQMGFYMSDLINERRVFLTCEREEDKVLIRQELEQVRKKRMDSDMKNALVPKEEVTKRLRRSPDFWDAILMRHFFEYKGQVIQIKQRNGNDRNLFPGLPDRRRWERAEYNR